ncbi:unnamed protein product [Prorocentrum cordatum]|uniref:non-specific serine/threonine protein kinase n=1 Tax=Prorocentrum cordatum TaxID=2364126 RepID=A0ABN9PZW7_9DINO|nr:unnamed protein product [Polarella glacialis]
MALTPQPVGQMLKKHCLIEVAKIGQGSFGQAILCHTSDGSKVVCKVIDVRQASVKERQEAQNEGQLLASLKHPYIVRYRDMFIDEGCLCILMAFCEGGDLKSKVEEASVSKRHIPEDQILVWMCQALLALAYVHSKRVLHRDLKSSNFFLSRGGSLKMGDFGIAKVLGSTAALAQTMIGTPHFLSPEVCQGRPYAWPSDIWAMGCVMYELCALRVPFNAPDLVRLVNKVCRGPLPPIPGCYSSFVRQLLGEMLHRSQGQRPSAEAILHRPPMQARVRRLLEQAQAAPAGSSGSSGSEGLSGGPTAAARRRVAASPRGRPPPPASAQQLRAEGPRPRSSERSSARSSARSSRSPSPRAGPARRPVGPRPPGGRPAAPCRRLLRRCPGGDLAVAPPQQRRGEAAAAAAAPAPLAEGDLTRLCAELGLGAARAGLGAALAGAAPPARRGSEAAGGADDPSVTALLEQELERMAAEEAAHGIGPFCPAARGG